MLITIIIPIYKVEKYIEDCIKSVMSQTYQGDIECILVNDCTPDNSCQIAEQVIADYRGNIDFKILHHEQNQGLSVARNTGLNAASGEYVYFLDSDDEITPNCIESLVAPLRNNNYDFVIGDYITTGSKRYSPPLKMDEGEYLTNVLIRTSYLDGEWYPMGWNKLCNTRFLLQNNLLFKENIIHEDELWSFQIANFAQSMYVCKAICYNYKMRYNSIMNVPVINENSMKSRICIMNEYIKFAKSKKILDRKMFSFILVRAEWWFGELYDWRGVDVVPYIISLKSAFKINPISTYIKGNMTFKMLIKYLYLIMPDKLAIYYWKCCMSIKKIHF